MPIADGRIIDPMAIPIVGPDDLPNPNWLFPCTPNKNQQLYGDDLLRDHRFILILSAVSRHCWNLIFDATKPAADYDDITQERFALDLGLQP